MNDRRASYREIRRRETRSPRSVLASICAIALILVLAWAALEILLDVLKWPPLLVSPENAARALVDVAPAAAPWLIAAGAIAALIGLVLIGVGIAGGRRARHLLPTERSVTVVDDEAIASALARHASLAADIGPDSTRVTVTRRHADIRMTPISGTPIDGTAVRDAVARELASYVLQPALLPPRLLVDQRGKVGA